MAPATSQLHCSLTVKLKLKATLALENDQLTSAIIVTFAVCLIPLCDFTCLHSSVFGSTVVYSKCSCYRKPAFFVF